MPCGTVDEFVAAKASKINRLQQLSISGGFALLNLKDFQDLDFVGDFQQAVVTNPGDTGYARAYPNLLTLLKNKWNIEHRDDDLIGIRVRDV